MLALAVPYLIQRHKQVGVRPGDFGRLGFFGAVGVTIGLEIVGMRWRSVALQRLVGAIKTAVVLLVVLIWNLYLVAFGNKAASLIALSGFIVNLEPGVTCTMVSCQQDKHTQQSLGLLSVQFLPRNSPFL